MQAACLIFIRVYLIEFISLFLPILTQCKVSDKTIISDCWLFYRLIGSISVLCETMPYGARHRAR